MNQWIRHVVEYSPDVVRRAAGAVQITLHGAADELFPAAITRFNELQKNTRWQADTAEDYCNACGATVHASAVTPRGCPFCADKRLPWRSLTRLGAYQDPLRQWLLELKYHRLWKLSDPLGDQLAASITQQLPEVCNDAKPWTITHVPLHWRRRAQRGYNQAYLLAERIARNLSREHLSLIRRSRHTLPQTSLPASYRPRNVANAFSPRPSRPIGSTPIDLTNTHVLLIDDVKTTGSTLHQCIKVLRKMNAASVHVAVLCVADPHGSDFRYQ